MIKKLLLTLILVVMVIGQASADSCIILVPKTEKIESMATYPKDGMCDRASIFITTNDKYGARKDYRKKSNNNITSLSYRYSNVKSAQFCIKPAVYVHKGGKR